MTDPTEPTDPTHPEDDATGTTSRRRRLLLAVAASLVVAAVVVALVVRGGGDGSEGPTPGPASTRASTSTPGPTPRPGTEGDPAAGTEPPATTGDAPVDREQPPVALDASPVLVDGITLRVESLTAVDADAALPGEVAGPGVSVTIVVDNAGDEALDLSTTVVNAYSGEDLTPGETVSTGTSRLPDRVEAGSTATGTYVFTVPAEERDAVRVTVDAAVDLPTIVFEGPAS
ncbi:hypothetical protein [Frigoribacterium salinisoli]